MQVGLPVVEQVDDPSLYPGGWWHTEEDRVVCDLCPRACSLKEGDRGFCFVRQNVDNRMVLTTYGRSTGFCIDPIEKKPLNHFYPGTSILSFGTAGCNLGCKFCQNWDISKSREIERLSARAMPEDIARAASSLGCSSVAFTYNDPVIWAEYAIDTARACRAAGLKTVAVTAGYITEDARRPFYDAMDAANVDLKAFTEEFYHKLTLSHLGPVLDTLRWLKHETDVWFEITNLVIPDANDGFDEIRKMCDWILENVGDQVPLHFTAFHPDFRMMDRPRTPPATLTEAREIALQHGLKYVYTGNVDDVRRQSTYCPGCGKVVIERNWYELGRYALNGNVCAHCGHTIAGRFADRPGTWGRRRLPVDMRQFTTPQTAPAGGQAPPRPAVPSTQQNPHGQKGASGMATEALPATQPELTSEQQQSVLAAAADVVTAATRNRPLTGPDLGEVGGRTVDGVFVSLKRKGHLRSCCGTFGQRMPLDQALRQAAVRAATDDPRFPRVSPSELEYLDLEVWALDRCEPVSETGEDRVQAIQVGRHGLQVIQGSRRGLLLPSVPVDHGWSEEEFLNQTCIKAGLSPTAWRDDQTTLLKFQGQSFGRRLSDNGSAADAPETKPLFSGREFAAYAQHCRGTIETFLTGGTPLAYCTTVSDANVHYAAVIVTDSRTNQESTFAEFSVKGTVPLQATLFNLCQRQAQILANAGIRIGEYDVDVAIGHDPTMHGTVAAPDLSGVDPQKRAVLAAERGRNAFVYNSDATADDLLKDATASAQIAQPELAQVFSFAVVSTKNPLRVISVPRAVRGQEVRPPAVAGTFYPGDAAAMNQMLDKMLEGDAPRRRWSACMVPHAGWTFSGRLAADVLKRIELPKTVIAIGPKHTSLGMEWSVAPHRTWSLPGVSLDSDADLAAELANAIDGLELDAAAHQREHGVEVELPIIQRLSPDTKVVGIAVGGGDLERCQQFADGLAGVVSKLKERPLLLISSDMNHFATDAENRRLDELALVELDQPDPDSLYQTVRENHISMCGVLPAVIILKTLEKLGGLQTAERVGYATSADASGDTSRVVGYAGMLFQ